MIPITHPSPHQPPPHPPHTNSRPPAPGDTHPSRPPLPPLPYPPHLSQHPPPHDDRRYHGTDRFPPLPRYLPSHGTLHGLYISSSTAEKPKLPRASQACNSCRDHKVRCDELKPCKNCHDKKVECKYRELEPKPQDKVAAHILETLMYLRFEFCRFGHRINQLEIALNRVAPSVEEQPLAPVDYDDDRAESPPPMGDGAYSSSPGEAPTVTAPIDIVEARNITRGMEEEMEVEPGPYVRPGALAIPLNHTTLAALLLKWQSIESLVRGCLEAENVKWIDEFPIRQEERRGLLRVWGRGEGVDCAKVDREPHDFGMMEVNDDYSDAGAPSPADCWGGISGSPGPGDGKLPVNPPLDFTESAIWKYVKSFQDNIQNMHPLIIPVELNAMVKLFLDSVHTSNKRAKLSYAREATVARFASYHLPPITARPGEVGSKRKRSSPEQSGADSPSATKLTRPTFQRSINNALVLLVLALGKICLHKDKKIPGVVPVSEPSHGSPVVRNGYPASPTQGSPTVFPLHSHTSGLPSPNENAERSGSRPSFQGGAPPMKTGFSHKRNMDVIPGLDYFAYAIDILGAQLAGTSLHHIHANILAGLYYGQLGRVMESYAYIYKAGWALQIKLRPSLDRFKKLQENLPSNIMAVTEKSDNQLVFAFWTCLQLESDIIAELPLPQSHILAFEEIMPYPNLNLAKQHGFDEYTLQSYVAQLYLRKSLNQIHQMLYNPENHRGQDQAGIPTLSIINYIQNSLDMRFVPPEFKFNDNDPPANDILAARLRAKYWGAQVITYRPFIRQILESSHHGLPFTSPLPVSGGNNNFSGGDPATTAASPLESRSSQEHSEEIMQNAVKGIRALIESTRAFHGVPDRRFIITNVFGTAHAQWGNLLTLAAVFRNPILTHYINEQTLRGLFAKTIAFFRLVSQPSSALWIDMRILEGLESELWGSNKPSSVDPVNVAQQQQDGPSFSSTAIEGAVPTTFPLTHR